VLAHNLETVPRLYPLVRVQARYDRSRGVLRHAKSRGFTTKTGIMLGLGETQEEIARRVGVTRPQVSRLLKQARAEGVVDIRIVDRLSATSPAAETLRQRFGLKAVHLAPTLTGEEGLTRRSVGRLAAQVLRDAVRDGMVVGIGDGAAVSAAADAWADVESPVSATVVPLCGGFWIGDAAREPYRDHQPRVALQVPGVAVLGPEANEVVVREVGAVPAQQLPLAREQPQQAQPEPEQDAGGDQHAAHGRLSPAARRLLRCPCR